jgi:hypothetical protein
MTDATDRLLDLPLYKVAIPGSHDSGAYGRRVPAKCLGGDCNTVLRKYMWIPLVDIVVQNWAKVFYYIYRMYNILHSTFSGYYN